MHIISRLGETKRLCQAGKKSLRTVYHILHEKRGKTKNKKKYKTRTNILTNNNGEQMNQYINQINRILTTK
jgi:hypothetical protein